MHNDYKPSVLIAPFYLANLFDWAMEYAYNRTTGAPFRIYQIAQMHAKDFPAPELETMIGRIERRMNMGEIPESTRDDWERTRDLLRDELKRKKEQP